MRRTLRNTLGKVDEDPTCNTAGHIRKDDAMAGIDEREEEVLCHGTK